MPAISTRRQRFPGSITDIAGLSVGHFTDTRRPTGCSVVLAPDGAVAGVDVRGAAPGTRETDLLAPVNLVEQVHAVMLSGGSAYGLDAASGAMHWLEQHGLGLNVGVGRVPIVPAAVLFDLIVGDPSLRPDAAAGYAACEAAHQAASHAKQRRPAEGNVGAGTGAAIGKLFGLDCAMRGGIGTASLRHGGISVAALVACNALGDVIDPDTALPLAGSRRSANSLRLRDSRRALLRGATPKLVLRGTNTTIGVIATDARLNKAQCQRLAMAGHDGLARSINPVHTQSDGDTLFALATGRTDAAPDLLTLAALAAEVTARAVVNAVIAAEGLRLEAGERHAALWLPAWGDL